MVAAFYAAPAPARSAAASGGSTRRERRRRSGRRAFEETRTRAGHDARQLADDPHPRDTPAPHSSAGTIARSDVAVRRRRRALAAERIACASRADVTQALGAAAVRRPVSAAVGARSKAAPQGLVAPGHRRLQPRRATQSPASVWPGADTGHARDVLLRAHPLLDDGDHRRRRVRPASRVRHGRGAALDAAAAAADPLAPAVVRRHARARGADSPQLVRRAQIDAGAGLRVASRARASCAIDVAHGLRDGGMVVSAGWDRRWR